MMAHILHLPREIVVLIFKYYLETENQRDFLTCISNVCEEWSNICLDTQFWKKIDGSLSQQTLVKFCKEGRLRQTDEVTLGYSKEFNSKFITLPKILSGLPNLKTINFSNIRYINETDLTSVGEHCCKLTEIKFADNIFTPGYTVTVKLMGNFLKLRGEFLNVIDLSYSKIGCLKQLLCEVAQACPNLEQLLLQNLRETSIAVFPIESVKKGCLKLKVLRLGMPVTFSSNHSSKDDGFSALEIFTHPISSIHFEFKEKDFMNILSNSSNLKVLDVRGCAYISINAILSLPATHLENIYLSMTRFYCNNRMTEIFQKWGRSLRIVDISKLKGNIDHILLEAISMGTMVNLESLDVSGTTISTATVIKIIENLEHLHVLNLSSCRNIGRGRMRKHQDKDEINILYKSLTTDYN